MSKLHDAEVDEYLRKSVSIEPLALNEEFVQLPSDLAYWNAQYADALRGALMEKLVCEQTEARARIECRELLLASNSKVTESMVEAALLASPEYEAARLRTLEAEVKRVRANGVVDAIRAKKDMLVSLGAHVRAEMDGSPRIREEHQVRRG